MTTARFAGAAGKDNTDRLVRRDYQAPTYAASIALAIKPFAAKTLVVLALTGALSLTVNVGDATTPPMVGDELQIQASSDGTSRIITFSTGFLATGTFSVTTAKYAVINFVFNGTGWLETGRAVSA